MNIFIVGYITIGGYDANLFWSLVSCVLAVPVFTNLIALVALRKKFWQLFKDYKARYMGIGTVDTDFKLFNETEPNDEAKALNEKFKALEKNQ